MEYPIALTSTETIHAKYIVFKVRDKTNFILDFNSLFDVTTGAHTVVTANTSLTDLVPTPITYDVGNDYFITKTGAVAGVTYGTYPIFSKTWLKFTLDTDLTANKDYITLEDIIFVGENGGYKETALPITTTSTTL